MGAVELFPPWYGFLVNHMQALVGLAVGAVIGVALGFMGALIVASLFRKWGERFWK